MQNHKRDFLNSVVFGDPEFVQSLKNLTASVVDIQKSLIENPAIRQINEIVSSIHKNCVGDFAQKIQGFVDSVRPNFCNWGDECFENIYRNMRYMKSLKESGWPLFHLEFEHPEELSSLKKEDFFFFMLNYYENSYKIKLIDFWMNSPILNPERFPILREALDLFDNKFYYGTCSVLMCQLYGIAEDIDVYAKTHSLTISEEDMKGIDELYGIIDVRKCPKEKRRLFHKLMYVRKHILSWDKTLTYVNDFILKSPREPIESLKVPHRNKICHGEQTNFGTQEHALKAILVVDALIRFSNEVYSSTQDCC